MSVLGHEQGVVPEGKMKDKLNLIGLFGGVFLAMLGVVLVPVASAQGTRTRTKPVSVSITNTVFVATGNLTGNGTVKAPVGSGGTVSPNPATGTFNISAKVQGSSPQGTVTYSAPGAVF